MAFPINRFITSRDIYFEGKKKKKKVAKAAIESGTSLTQAKDEYSGAAAVPSVSTLSLEEKTERAANKIQRVRNSMGNMQARRLNDGSSAFKLKETATKIPGRVAYGDTEVFASAVLAAIPELLKRLKSPASILALGDGKATDIKSIRLAQTDEFLKTRPNKKEPVTAENLLALVRQATATRLDIHSFSDDDINTAISSAITIVGHKNPDRMDRIRNYYTGAKQGQRPVVQKGSLLDKPDTRKLIIGEMVPHDFRTDDPLPKSDITVFGQLLHYFDTIPPDNVDPYKEIPISPRAKFIKKATAHKPKFIVLSDKPVYTHMQIPDDAGHYSSFLAEGYIPNRELHQKYNTVGHIGHVLDEMGKKRPENSVFEHKPIEAEKIRSDKASLIQWAWLKRSYRKRHAARLKQ